MTDENDVKIAVLTERQKQQHDGINDRMDKIETGQATQRKQLVGIGAGLISILAAKLLEKFL